MREFILKASKASTIPFDLNDLSAAGRMDLVCRCISNALFVSDAIRGDTIFHAVLEGPANPPKTVSFSGKDIVEFAPDERYIASAIRAVVKAKADGEIFPGIKIEKKSFERLVEEKAKTHQLLYMHRKGTDIRDVKFEKDFCFILGDQQGIGRKTEHLLDRFGASRISVGRPSYFASHVIIICQNELDRRATGPDETFRSI